MRVRILPLLIMIDDWTIWAGTRIKGTLVTSSSFLMKRSSTAWSAAIEKITLLNFVVKLLKSPIFPGSHDIYLDGLLYLCLGSHLSSISTGPMLHYKLLALSSHHLSKNGDIQNDLKFRKPSFIVDYFEYLVK